MLTNSESLSSSNIFDISNLTPEQQKAIADAAASMGLLPDEFLELNLLIYNTNEPLIIEPSDSPQPPTITTVKP
jgi:hypothetical protein